MPHKLSRAISEFLETSLLSQSAINYAQYFRTLQRFQEDVGDIELKDLLCNPKMIISFYSKMTSQFNLRETSLFLIALNLRVFLKYLQKQGVIDQKINLNTFTQYQKYYDSYRIHAKELIPEALYPFEEDQLRLYWLLQEPNILSLRNAVIICILLDTGIKISTLRKLTRKSVLLKKAAISYLIDGQKRENTISNETISLLQSYLSIRTDPSISLIINHSPRITNTITNRTIERIIKQTTEDLDPLRKITSTNLRYTYIAKKIVEGNDDSKILQLAGYKSTTLQRFGLRKGTINQPEKNIYRHLEDFKRINELKNEWNLSKKELGKLISSKGVELRTIKSQKFIRESIAKKFIKQIEDRHTGYILLSVRALDWNIRKQRLSIFCKLNQEKCRKIQRKWYIHEGVLLTDIPSLRKRGRKNKK